MILPIHYRTFLYNPPTYPFTQVLELQQALGGSGKLSNGSGSPNGTTEESSPENGGKNGGKTNK